MKTVIKYCCEQLKGAVESKAITIQISSNLEINAIIDSKSSTSYWVLFYCPFCSAKIKEDN